MIVENGKCAVCGKQLEKDRLFICRECQKKEDELCDNRTKIHGCSFADETCKKNPCADCGVREGEANEPIQEDH